MKIGNETPLRRTDWRHFCFEDVSFLVNKNVQQNRNAMCCASNDIARGGVSKKNISKIWIIEKMIKSNKFVELKIVEYLLRTTSTSRHLK